MDYYAALELVPGSSDEEIKASYRRLARQNHPDVNPDDPGLATERIRAINEAYEILSDPQMRQRYDQEHGFDAPPPDAARTDDLAYLTPDPRVRQLRSAALFIVVVTCFGILLARAHMNQPSASPSTDSQPLTAGNSSLPGSPPSDVAGETGATGDALATTAGEPPLLEALTKNMEALQPQVDNVLRQGDSAYAAVGSQSIDSTSPSGAARRATIDRLSSDLAALRSDDSSAQLDLSTARRQSGAAAAPWIDRAASDMKAVVAAGRLVVEDVHQLSAPGK